MTARKCRGRIETIPVGIAEYAVTDERAVLKTSGLGSCIGVAVHDEAARVSGLLHFMLPDATEVDDPASPDAKFADTGIERLLAEFSDLGGDPDRSWAKVAGGASMLEFDRLDRSIGERNVDAVRRELQARGIAIVEADFGGDFGRTIEFDAGTGTLTVTSAQRAKRRL